jgi:hypothetical protein
MRCLGINRNLRRCNRTIEGHLFCIDHRRQPIVWIFVLIFTVFAGIASIYSAIQGANQRKAEDSVAENNNEHSSTNETGDQELADVTLRFVYPKSPALILVNNSEVIAKNIKWSVALWNMDLPDRNDPLPIPVSTFDWIKPHNEGGPQNLFNTRIVSPLLKQGNRLFGSVSLDCPKCKRGRTYIVRITWGVGGWYAEIETGTPGKLLIPPNFLKDSRTKYFKALEAAVPEQSRISIGKL